MDLIEKVGKAINDVCKIRGVDPDASRDHIVYMQEDDARALYDEIVAAAGQALAPICRTFEEFVTVSAVKIDPKVKKGTVEVWLP